MSGTGNICLWRSRSQQNDTNEWVLKNGNVIWNSCRLLNPTPILCQGRWDLRHCALHKATDLQFHCSWNCVGHMRPLFNWFDVCLFETSIPFRFKIANFPLFFERIIKGTKKQWFLDFFFLKLFCLFSLVVMWHLNISLWPLILVIRGYVSFWICPGLKYKVYRSHLSSFSFLKGRW